MRLVERGRMQRRRLATLVVVAGLLALDLVAPQGPPAEADTNEAPPTIVRTWGIRGTGLPGAPQIPDGDALTVDAAGNVYVADALDRIQKFAPDGTRLAVIGSHGTAPGQFNHLEEIVLGANGNLYTLESCYGAACVDRVQQLTTAGAPVSSFPVGADQTSDLAVDSTGNVFVAATTPRQVLKYAPDGTLSTSWPAGVALDGIDVAGGQVYAASDSDGEVHVYAATNGAFVRSFGQRGNDPGEVSSVHDVVVDAADHAFVLDDDQVVEFDETGAFVASWGSTGSGDGQFTLAYNLWQGPDDHFWTLDRTLGRVQEFDAAHAFVRRWGSFGDGGGQFLHARGVAIDGAGNVYVADTDNHRIQKFDPSGNFLMSWGTLGAGPGRFNRPEDVDVAAGSVFVSDTGNDRIQRFSPAGDFQAAFGSRGTAAGQMNSPSGIDVGSDGTVYVADSGNARIQVFDATGTSVRRIPVDGYPDAVAVDPQGIVHVVTCCSSLGGTVQRFALTGEPRGSWDLAAEVPGTKLNAIEFDQVGNAWLDDWAHDQIVKVRPDGTEIARIPVPKLPPVSDGITDFAFRADRRIVAVSPADANSSSCCDAPVIYELQGGTGALVDVTLSVDQVTTTVGDPLDYHVTVRNTGTVPLTGIATSSTSLPECAGPVGDLVPGAAQVVDCTHVAGVGDHGQFAGTVTATTTQGAQAPSNTVTVPVGRDQAPVLSRLLFLGNFPQARKGIDTHPDGGYYVGGASSIKRYTAVGGSGASFSVPNLDDVARGPTGDLFVAATQALVTDADDGVVRRYSPEGTLVSTYVAPNLNGTYAGVDVDDTGQVFVAERRRTVCIQRDFSNACIATGLRGTSQVVRFTADGNSSVTFGAPGTGDGQLDQPSDVAVSGDRVYVADTGNDRVVTFTDTGTFVRNLPLNAATSVATAPDGTLYAASAEDGLVQAYAPDGTLVSSWQTPATTPQRVATDADGRVWVLDLVMARTRVYAPAGRVEGTVSTAGSGAPVAGAFVAVLRSSDFAMSGTGVADGSGHFSVAVPAGSHFVYAVDPTGAHVAGFAGAPTSVTVPVAGSVVSDPALAPNRGSITGTVTEEGSGTPVAGAMVVVMSATGEAQRVATANGAGVYSVSGLTAGNHLVAFLDPTGGHRPEFFPNATDALGASPVAVTAGQEATANGALPVQGPAGGGATLSGTVTGPGGALAGAQVIALRASDFAFVRAGVTNGSGAYSLSVPAAGYKVGFIDGSGGHAMEWHDNQPFHGLASATTVTAPTVANAALALTTGHIGGTVTDPTGPNAGAWVIAIGPSGVAGGDVTAANGTYDITGLAPGSYRVTIVDTTAAYPQEYWQNASSFGAAALVNVTAGGASTINPVLG